MKREEITALIANGESSGLEFKRDDIRPEQLAKEVVALANLKGGHILLGVADNGTIVGTTRSNLAEWVADTVFARYIHPLILPYYEEIIMDEEKRVAVVTIGLEIAKPYVVRANDRETAYVRIGAVTQPATREHLLMLGAASGFIHTEIMPVNRTTFESLDMARLENYLRDILKDPEVPGTREAWLTRLQALGFMTAGVTEEPVCTIAGLVLFGIRPRQMLKQSGVRLLFFDSLDKQYQAQLDKALDSPLVGRFQVGKTGKTLIDGGLIEKCLETMEPFVTQEAGEIDQNFRREKRWLYPFEVIRELMINALAHRDWTRFVDIEIAGYSNRLEIISPGPLPTAMTVEKMLAGQRSARNHIIVEVLRDYGYVDARGMGVRTKVVPALKNLGIEAQFEATEDYLKTIIKKVSVGISDGMNSSDVMGVGKASGKEGIAVGKEGGSVPAMAKPLTVDVGKTSEKILDAIRNRKHITIPELANLIGVTERTIERNLHTLQAKGLIRRAGGRKQGCWEIITT
ncbi:MAG: transcriptional regulator [Deltaproteobacteria bacterium RIFOXYD12_FULL_50_9]|nr:MAG: transcriptional regulator [Deltaproteobacteria bacterium RIFOXYD12_FULL_50_9]